MSINVIYNKILLEKQELGHKFETPIPKTGIFDFK
jgi:hypothetical protein